ncbi:pilus assembly protein PilP [Alteromonas sp. ASW11-36]|uniref:Pilus assembly protein PilP n=1 Tax=Alteromonas arenosi TaxID=3055817 RepID=A0ABT7SZK1_9ALTE|nr:pilus assembly protein PilP [Alteromonas sp. ASW11-36]MDM7861623.1 pilus assembly protein PilP [Alteromonas sp. ASW11-36]
MSQKARVLIPMVVLATLCGCSADIGDLTAYTQQVRANTQVSIEPYPEFETQPTFEYTASELRSPFVRPRIAEQAVVEAVQANCLQPDFNRRKQPLESYGIDAIAMSGVFNANGRNYVLFKTNDGMLHKATYGNYIGLFHGKITAITNQTVKITELLPDGAGCWQQKETELTMASLAGENDNV